MGEKKIRHEFTSNYPVLLQNKGVKKKETESLSMCLVSVTERKSSRASGWGLVFKINGNYIYGMFHKFVLPHRNIIYFPEPQCILSGCLKSKAISLSLEKKSRKEISLKKLYRNICNVSKCNF